MKIVVSQGEIQASAADTIIVNLFNDVTTPSGATGAIDQALDGAISELIASGDLTGKAGEVGVLYPRGAMATKRVLVVGLGQRDGFNVEGVRQAAANGIKQAHKLKAKSVATIVHGAGIAGLDVEAAAQATVEGSLLATYRFAATKQEPEPPHEIESLTIVEFDGDKVTAIEAGSAQAQAIAAGVALARDLVNMPPNVATPT